MMKLSGAFIISATAAFFVAGGVSGQSMYEYVGCVFDSAATRVLTADSVKGDSEMTTEVCASFCEGYAHFGTEYSNECFCGSSSDVVGDVGFATCDMPCAGDSSEICGGWNVMSVYRYDGTTPSPTVPPTPAPVPTTPTAYDYIGCAFDSNSNRVFSGESIKGDSAMTTEVCDAFCAGSTYFGTEYGNECFCGPQSDAAPDVGFATCDFECEGDSSQTCGGWNAISVYKYTEPSTSSWVYQGCYNDNRSQRVMDIDLSTDNMTNEMCEDLCFGYPYFATQFGKECWCGDDNTDYSYYGESDSCNFPCAGDNDQYCGGYLTMSVWADLE